MGSCNLDIELKFPDINNYDISKPRDLTLYLVHYDSCPFRSVIDNNKIVLDAISEAYIKMANETQIANDYIIEEWAIKCQNLRMAKMDLQTL